MRSSQQLQSLTSLSVSHQDGVNSYTCTCALGWAGTNCDVNIDDCDPNPCQNGQCEVRLVDRCMGRTNISHNMQCIFFAASYVCGFERETTLIITKTMWSSQQLQSLTSLSVSHQDGVDSYTCTCALGWAGTNCDVNIDDCDPNPCQNGQCEVRLVDRWGEQIYRTTCSVYFLLQDMCVANFVFNQMLLPCRINQVWTLMNVPVSLGGQAEIVTSAKVKTAEVKTAEVTRTATPVVMTVIIAKTNAVVIPARMEQLAT